jgi:hypothetical protein
MRCLQHVATLRALNSALPMLTKTTTHLAAFTLLTLAGARPAFADIPPPVDCTGMKAGAACVQPTGQDGVCVEQNGSLVCATACDPTSGSGCCDVTTGKTCCGTNLPNGVCKSVTGGYACDTTDTQACNGQSKGASCKTGAGEMGTCETTGDSECSFLTCKPSAGSTGSGASGMAGGTSGGSGSGGGCSIERLPASAPIGAGLLVATLGATALRRRRSRR